MGMMKFEVPHQLSKDQARERVNRLLEYWNRKYGIQSDWSGDRAQVAGKAMGIGINARLEVTDRAITGEASDPGFLFRDKARKYLTDKFNAALDPKAAPDRPPED